MKNGEIFFDKEVNCPVKVIDFAGENRKCLYVLRANKDSCDIIPLFFLREATKQEVTDYVTMREIRKGYQNV